VTSSANFKLNGGQAQGIAALAAWRAQLTCSAHNSIMSQELSISDGPFESVDRALGQRDPKCRRNSLLKCPTVNDTGILMKAVRIKEMEIGSGIIEKSNTKVCHCCSISH